jgi:hypothetical protein
VVATVIAALIAGLIAGTGWFISSYLTGAREDRTNRLRLTLDYSERQISEFYAPILGLLTRLNAIYKAQNQVSARHITDLDLDKFHDFIYVEYFLPIHVEIANLINPKIHLLEGNRIPRSIESYLRHFASENIGWRVAKEIDQAVNLFHHVVPFPDEIWDEMQDHRKLIRERYETTIQELRKNPVFFGPIPAAAKACGADLLSKHTPARG